MNGFLEFSYDLGAGPAVILNDEINVNDGERHSVILKRHGRSGSIEIDNDYYRAGGSSGFTESMNTNGNIYLGTEKIFFYFFLFFIFHFL